MTETTTIILSILLALIGGGGVITTILNIRANKELYKLKQKDETEAAKRKEELTKQQTEATQLKNLTAGMLTYMEDRLLWLCKRAMDAGEISFDDRRIIMRMHDAYEKLGGNGDYDEIMSMIRNLPCSKSEDK